MINAALIGYGYWGPNLARNIARSSSYDLGWIVDLDDKNLQLAKESYPWIQVSNDASQVLAQEDVDLVIIATPVSTHYSLASAALKANKHVFVEKPLTDNYGQAQALHVEATARNLVLMVDHTFIFTGAVKKIEELLEEKALGDIYYYDSTRVNLGLLQHDVSVIWDLAVHDFAILDYLFRRKPFSISAVGFAHFPNTPVNTAFISAKYEDNLIAHINVNWLAPVKLRQTLIGGSEKMVFYNDLEPSEKVKIFDHGISLSHNQDLQENDLTKLKIGYRKGDIFLPQLSSREALEVEFEYLAKCIESSCSPINDAGMGARVVQLVCAAEESMRLNGAPVNI